MAAPLSRERILSCAVTVADRDGLDAASLRRIAAELGVHVTSIYNHVPTKEALLDGIVEELLAGADVPLDTLDWEQWVRRFVAAVCGLARKHPGAFGVLLHRPVQGPRASATFEVGLAAFHEAGMDSRAAYGAVKCVALAVLGACMEQASAAAADEVMTDVSSLSHVDFPMLHAVTEVAVDFDVVAVLTELIVSGLRQQIPRRKR